MAAIKPAPLGPNGFLLAIHERSLRHFGGL